MGAQPTEAVEAILKITGDWQKFKGLPGTEGTLKVKEPKRAKLEIFNEALKDAASEPKGGATTATKKAEKKAEEARGRGPPKAPAAEAPAEAAAEAPAEAPPRRPPRTLRLPCPPTRLPRARPTRPRPPRHAERRQAEA